jgi:3-methyladenine DNA glycosylase AlkC
MAELFKDVFNTHLITLMGQHFSKHDRCFDLEKFSCLAGDNLKQLELKERSNQITQAMHACLPKDYQKTSEILLASLAPELENISGAQTSDQGIIGWGILPMTHYVALYGQDCLRLSMDLLKEMTKRFTSEFGIRPFLLQQQQATLAILDSWIEDPNYHVRRLISEGTRPRLPWAAQIPAFINNPEPILPLLEALKDDEAEYVRKSVANSLNDIAKDHPSVVVDCASQWWKGASTNRQRLVKHGCRTLIKQGNKDILKILGYSSPKIGPVLLSIKTPMVKLGESLEFSVEITSTSPQEQPLLIDYIVHHRKANGSTAPKVFKGKTLTLLPKENNVMERKHPIRPITTRKYYSGEHYLEILVNGTSVAKSKFELKIS